MKLISTSHHFEFWRGTDDIVEPSLHDCTLLCAESLGEGVRLMFDYYGKHQIQITFGGWSILWSAGTVFPLIVSDASFIPEPADKARIYSGIHEGAAAIQRLEDTGQTYLRGSFWVFGIEPNMGDHLAVLGTGPLDESNLTIERFEPIG